MRNKSAAKLTVSACHISLLEYRDHNRHCSHDEVGHGHDDDPEFHDGILRGGQNTKAIRPLLVMAAVALAVVHGKAQINKVA